jgi:GxxExxY protein
MSFTEKEYNLLSEKIIGCAIEVHKQLGPGLLESVYEICMYKELVRAGLNAKKQVCVPVFYKDELLDKEFVIDILVEDKIVLEIKSLETILPVHEAQVVTYLKLSNHRLGLLLNFNVDMMKKGIKRKINGNLNISDSEILYLNNN